MTFINNKKILATLNNFLTEKSTDEEKFKKSNFNYEMMVQLMNHASLSVDPVPKPLLADTGNSLCVTPLFMHRERYEKLFEPLKENIRKLTSYFPTSLHDSFIFNFVEVFCYISNSFNMNDLFFCRNLNQFFQH